ncbi:MAG: glycosyltransferase family A protein [Erythrobacter sp.]|uniref:glycosyltransferase family 2 protein n=1 Tax=Erythrobacter sp. TaxID=1042 RepID=UPI00326634C6
MPNPTFSVIIPAYNAERTLRTTVASVLDQNEKSLEIIIVDDGSSDGTLHMMLDLACTDMRIRAVSQPNSGVSATRNFGASIARGELLAFLDADDQWHADKLQRHRELHETNPSIHASYAVAQFCEDTRGTIQPGPSLSTVSQNAQLAVHTIGDVVIENPVCTTSNFVISRCVFADLGGFSESLRYAEDQEFLARLVSQDYRLCGINRALVKYRMSTDGLSCDLEAMLNGWRSFAGDWLDGGDLQRGEATYCRYLARRALRSGAKISAVRSYVRQGLTADRVSFMSAHSRSLLTIIGAYLGGMLPASVRRTVFA